jgi:hypothetical protein
MEQKLAYQKREEQAASSARQAREEAHWARMYRVARRTAFFAVLTGLCTVATAILLLTKDDDVKSSVRYAWNTIVPSMGSDREQRAVATTTPHSDDTQHRAAVAETTSKPTPDKPLQFASHPATDTGVATYSAPSRLGATGLINHFGEGYLNTSLTSPSVIGGGGLNLASAALNNSGLIHLASSALPSPSLTSSWVTDSSGLHLASATLLNPSLPSSSVIGGSGLNLTSPTTLNDSGLIHLASSALPSPSLTSPWVTDSSGLHLASSALPNPSLTSPSVIGGSGLWHPQGVVRQPSTDLIGR